MNTRQLERLDWWLFWGVIVAAVADIILNYIGSYGHIYVEGIHHGEYGVDARTLPIAIDLILSVLAGATVIASRLDRSTWQLRLTLFFAVCTTIAANGAYGAAWGRTGALMAVWSPVGLVIVVETGLYMFRIVADAKAKAAKAAVPAMREPTPEELAELVAEHQARTLATVQAPAADFPPAPQLTPQAWEALNRTQGLAGYGPANGSGLQ